MFYNTTIYCREFCSA